MNMARRIRKMIYAPVMLIAAVLLFMAGMVFSLFTFVAERARMAGEAARTRLPAREAAP